MAFIDKFGANSAGNGKNWTVGKRFMVVTFVGSGIIMLLGLISMFALNRINNYEERLVNAYIAEWEQATTFEQEVRNVGYDQLQYSKTKDNKKYEQALARFETLNKDLRGLRQLGQEQQLPELNRQIDGMQNAASNYKNSIEKFFQANEELQTFRMDVENASEELISILNNYLANPRAERVDEVAQLQIKITDNARRLW